MAFRALPSGFAATAFSLCKTSGVVAALVFGLSGCNVTSDSAAQPGDSQATGGGSDDATGSVSGAGGGAETSSSSTVSSSQSGVTTGAGGDATTTASASGAGGDSPAGSTTGDGSGGTGAGEGGAGNATSSTGSGGATSTGGTGGGSSSVGSGGAGGTGGGVVTGCASDAECAAADSSRPLCDAELGICVGCSTEADCAVGLHCNEGSHACEVGCDDDVDCDSGSGLVCDVASHTCVGCVIDDECPSGSLCAGGGCVPGCTDAHACQNGFDCCGGSCFDLVNDEAHCGGCSTACADVPHATEQCVDGACAIPTCDVGFRDCNGNAADGCEWSGGACVCTPGQVRSCYEGPAHTAGVGACAAGTQTCAASGTAWGFCAGQQLPVAEVCGNGIDDDCSGEADDGLDEDGDGWRVCDGDCCDSPSGGCSEPSAVNPGAYEYVDNGIDDDCDATTSDEMAEECSLAAKFSAVTGFDVAAAMDICRTSEAHPNLPEQRWGLIAAAQLLANGSTPSAAQLANMQNYQTAILEAYGTGGVTPITGPTMAGISTGRMRDQGDPGYANPNSGTSFGSGSQPPADFLAAHGGELPSSEGCSGSCPAGSGANDSVNVRLTIRVPTNARSFSYQFRFFSSEYWSYSCTKYNDFYLALLQTGAGGIPLDHNISFDTLGNPLSVNNGFFDFCVAKGCSTCPGSTGPLAGTGMQLGNTGGATDWLTSSAPVVPGETMVLELMIFDVSDNLLDSLSLLDHFSWSPDTAEVETH